MGKGKLVNRSELSNLLGVSLPTIDEWLRQGCPHVKRSVKGRNRVDINVGEVLFWHREREKFRSQGDLGSIEEEAARRRKLAAEAGLAELDLSIKESRAIWIKDAVAVWNKEIAACRAKLLSLPSKLGPLTAVENDAAKCKEIIRASIYEALAELSKFNPCDESRKPTWVEEPQEGNTKDHSSLGTSSKSNRKPVGRPRKKAKFRIKRRARAMDHR